jgi:hypothetical protein
MTTKSSTKAQDEAHAILNFLNVNFVQATGGWKSRARKLREMLVEHIETLEYLHEEASVTARKRNTHLDKLVDEAIAEFDAEEHPDL